MTEPAASKDDRTDGGDARAKQAQKDWNAFRRANPIEFLLPSTQRWAQSLSDEPPSSLLQAYPRVANRIAKGWSDAQGALHVLDDLLVDRRGGRKGFPPDVHAELLRLRDLIDGTRSPYGRRGNR